MEWNGSGRGGKRDAWRRGRKEREREREGNWKRGLGSFHFSVMYSSLQWKSIIGLYLAEFDTCAEEEEEEYEEESEE